MAPSEDYDPRIVRQRHQQYINDYALRRNQFQADVAEDNSRDSGKRSCYIIHPPSAKAAATTTTEHPFPQTVSDRRLKIPRSCRGSWRIYAQTQSSIGRRERKFFGKQITEELGELSVEERGAYVVQERIKSIVVKASSF